MSERQARSTAAHLIALAAIWGAAPAIFAGASALEGCTSPMAPQAATDAPQAATDAPRAPHASSAPSAWASASSPRPAAASEPAASEPTGAIPLLLPPVSDFSGPRIPDEEMGFKEKEEVVFLSDLAGKGGIVVAEKFVIYGRCVRRRAGSKEGFLCQKGGPHSERTGHALFSMSIIAIEGKTLREVFSFPNQARALDFPDGVYATLRVTYDEEKGTLELTDGMFSCEAATQSSDDSLEFKRVVDRLCQARGTYQLRGGAFVRTGQAPPLRWPGRPRRSLAPPPGNRSSL